MPATTSWRENGRREEGIGLALAIAAHVGLAAFLLWRPAGTALVTPPERMTVTLSDDLAPTSTSPDPNAQAAPDEAPTIGEAAPQPEPEPVAEPEPRPVPRVVQRPMPAPAAKPSPRPAARNQPPLRTAATRPAQRPATRPAGGTSFADAFKEGVPGARNKAGNSQSSSAAKAGPAVQASLASAISRQLKPRWNPPSGVDADKLVTVLAWNLNEDGSLAGTPRVVRQLGINDSNRPQASRHAEQAIRAVQLAAPFDLPKAYYANWKRVSSFQFDIRLAQ